MRPEVPSSCGRFCARCIFYGVLGHFCSKASLFTGFWPAQVAFDALFTAFWATPAPKPRYLQAFGWPGWGNLGFLRTKWLLILIRPEVPPSCARCIIYGVLGKFCSKASLLTCFFWLAQVAGDPLFTAFWATPAPKARYLQAFG